MILDCYIIREYLPDGKHTDHGYYERLEIFPCTEEEIHKGLRYWLYQ